MHNPELAFLEAHLFRYDKAFYPKEEVYVSTKDKEKKEEPVHYHMDVQFAPEEIIFSWKRVEASEDNANQNGITKCVAVDYTNRKETKNSLKRTLYRLLSEYTGVELPWGNLTGIRPTKIPMQMLDEGKTKEEIAGFLKEMELDDVAGKPVSEYSGGMKRRVAIARALSAEYDILIMDEPLQGLDAETKEKVATVIKTQTAGKTVLFVTHDEKEAEFFEAECMELV